MVADSFGALLRNLRVRMGFSQNHLARLAAIDPGYVNRLERAPPDSANFPSRKVVLALADALEVTTDTRERLLVAAGHCPEAIIRAGGWSAYQRHLRAALEDAVLAFDAAIRCEPVEATDAPNFVRRNHDAA